MGAQGRSRFLRQAPHLPDRPSAFSGVVLRMMVTTIALAIFVGC
jgi:hypothetical protein